ncbi:hypothetical protein [Paraglaciecola marina]|uniref:hypothetical protein n=1 Tax=Paraglaciecola marina TaxID=2500157 RepID=UPI0010608829|nr:hypothetical protein [Paraglaciecola marina]
MSWNVNEPAHRFLWRCVRSHKWDAATSGGSMTTFDEGGQWLNAFIIDVVPGDSPEMVRFKAEKFILILDRLMIDVHQNTHEAGYDLSKTIAELAPLFAAPESKLESCAEAVDNAYKCVGEDL